MPTDSWLQSLAVSAKVTGHAFTTLRFGWQRQVSTQPEQL